MQDELVELERQVSDQTFLLSFICAWISLTQSCVARGAQRGERMITRMGELVWTSYFNSQVS